MSTPASPLPTAAQWPEISRLLDEALALPPAGREAWLARLRATNAVHHEALSGLLNTLSKIEGDDFLDELPRLDVPETPRAAELQPGQTVGPYRLLREIGVGGMGTVWLAERADGLVQRHVALKLPRAVWGGSFAERLARESRILAALEHEHIARLYDAGLDAQGRPFLALEYVEGQAIDAYCREHALPLREREGLLLQTMAAVAHAHARLVVHRDLKPANILVTRDGQVKLLDFGIAKLIESDRTEATALTRVAGRALTVDYASPEQIRGEPLGTASDVYSLGVVAYELLAEAKPYRLRRGSAAEMEEAIASTDPMPASAAAASPALRKALRGDLDAILNRALKKSVDERYPSVDAFAQDLERHLRGEPVQARPDSRAYRAAKFVRRNGLAVALTSTLAASVVVGGGISVWWAVVAHRQDMRAETEVDRQQAVRDLYDETMMGLSVTAAEHPEAFRQPHVITAALRDKLHELEPRFRGRPAERAAQLEAVMLQFNYNDEFEESLAIAREYLAHLKAHGGSVNEVVSAYTVIGRNLFKLRRYDECEAMRRAGMNWMPDMDVDDQRTQLARLQIAGDLGNVLRFLGKRSEALDVLMQAQAIAARQPPEHASRYENGFLLANFWAGFNEVRQLQAAQIAKEGMQTVTSRSPDDRATNLTVYGVALLDNGRVVEAETTLQSARALYVEAYGRSSRNNAQAVGLLAAAIGRQGDYGRAKSLLDGETAAMSGADGVPAAFAPRLVERRLENAWLAGDVDELNKLLPATIAPPRDQGQARGNVVLLQYESRGLAMLGRGAEAVTVMSWLRRNWPEPNLATADCTHIQEGLALAQLAAGQSDDARATARGLAGLFEREHAVTGRTAVTAYELEALASARLGDTREAAQALESADLVQPAPPFTSDVAHADSLLRRAEVLKVLGHADQSMSAARAALALLKNQAPGSPRLAQARSFAAI